MPPSIHPSIHPSTTTTTTKTHMTHLHTTQHKPHHDKQVKIQAHYTVATSGVQNVLFQLCPTLVSAREVELKGEIGFQNPYGCVSWQFL
jgi:hypothetical protein